MKVLFLNYEYPPLGGGASIATEALLREWALLPEMEVHLVTAAVGDSQERIEVGRNVIIHRVPIGKNAEKLHSQSLLDISMYTIKAGWFLRTLLREEHEKKPFDVTLAFFTIPCGFLAYLLRLFWGIPYVVSLRGSDVPGFSEKYDGFYLLAKPLVRFLWRHAAMVVPNSVGITKLAERTASLPHLEIIENGVDIKTFFPRHERRSTSEVVFLSTSRLTPRKGIHLLIAAFALALKQSSVSMKLWLIGEGEQRADLEEQVRSLGIEQSVRFIGRVEHEALPDFYQQAHVFVLPSKNEGMSNSALEALASGLPLVVSGTGGMQELLQDDINGYFIDPDNAESFARTLTVIAGDQEKLVAYGTASRSRAEQRSWAAVAGRFEEVLEKSYRS